MVVDLIRGKRVVEAQLLLQFAAKHSALPVLKTLNSAIASAKNNFEADVANLYISHIAVNEGPKLKRYRPRARGQAYEIQKKTSHLTVVVDEIEQQESKAKKAQAKKPQEQTTSPGRPATPQKGLFGARAREKQEVISRPKEQRGVQRFFRRKAV